MRFPQKLVIAGGFVASALLSLAVMRAIIWAPANQLERMALAMIGRQESELIRELGQPQHTVLAATLAGRTVDYPWKGMNFVPVPAHPVRNKVLLYSDLNVAVYVFVDENGTVEHVAVAGT